MSTAIERRLQVRNDALETVRSKHEALLAERGEGNLSDTDKDQIKLYREETSSLMEEIAGLVADKEAHDRATENSKALRRASLGAVDGTEVNEDGIVYRTMAAYARDFIITREGTEASKIRAQFGNKDGVEAALARLELLKRTPANTLSSDVAGLTPPQHISEIFQVINNSRPLVNAARRTTLERGQLTYPQVDNSPVVAVQSAEKTEAGNTGMDVSMVTKTASTYLGGGDLSWQAINWSTPDALQLWFDLAAADYALKTETDAATVVSASAFLNNISSTLGATPTFAQLMTAVGAGMADVYANSGRLADSLIVAPDRYFYALGVTSDAFPQFASASAQGDFGGRVGPLNIIVSRGLNSGEMIVGDINALLVAETAGAPVELRVVEPAIGGVEVGLIGAFEAAVVDDGAFALITTAS